MEKDENGNWVLRIPLVGETKQRLERLAHFCGDIPPTALAASLLHDILEDDAAAHISPSDIPETSHRLN
jgi:hypothetical protein